MRVKTLDGWSRNCRLLCSICVCACTKELSRLEKKKKKSRITAGHVYIGIASFGTVLRR